MGTVTGRTIRWAIWGAGRIALEVGRDLALVEGSVLHAVAARRPEQAQHLAATLGAVRAHTSLAALCADTEVDVVYIATPNDCHMSDALTCISAGKAVMCEKPLTVTLAQARQVAEAAQRQKVFCMEAMWTRFLPAVQQARRWVLEGRIGRVQALEGSFGYRVKALPTDRLMSPALGGGALLDRGVYLLSLAQHLLGSPETIQGAWAPSASGVDEHSSYVLTYRDGASAQLSASLRTELSNQFVIAGESGRITLKAPFYKADALDVQAVWTHDMSTMGLNTSVGLKSRLKAWPLIPRAARSLAPWRQAIADLRVHRCPFSGSGYQFQMAEVAQCLREGCLESATMPLNDSLEIARQMDLLRHQWGMRLPQDV
jgi:dihydrodiol dehydrogenase / D-xylose 1-dehydrogenase (NADP)